MSGSHDSLLPSLSLTRVKRHVPPCRDLLTSRDSVTWLALSLSALSAVFSTFSFLPTPLPPTYPINHHQRASEIPCVPALPGIWRTFRVCLNTELRAFCTGLIPGPLSGQVGMHITHTLHDLAVCVITESWDFCFCTMKKWTMGKCHLAAVWNVHWFSHRAVGGAADTV